MMQSMEKAFLHGFALLLLTVGAGTAAAADPMEGGRDAFGAAPESPQSRPGEGRRRPGVYKDRLAPRWINGTARFWYRNDLKDEAREFILVDAGSGVRKPAFDHGKVAEALSKAAGTPCAADRLPFTEIQFIEDGKAILFKAAEKTWRCELETCQVAATDAAMTAPPEEPAGPQRRGRGPRGNRDKGRRRYAGDGSQPLASPDGKRTALVKEWNVVLREEGSDTEVRLTTDGVEGNAYARLEWSPDSSALVAWRVEPGEQKEVYLIRTSPQGGGRAQFEKRPYALPGDRFTRFEPSLIDPAARKQVRLEVDRFEHEGEEPRLRWSPDGTRFAWMQEDRGHQRLRVIDADARTGALRNIIDEKTSTFIWTAHTEDLHLQPVNWMEKTDEVIYASEMSGWRHLYLYDAREAKLLNPITRGDWVVRGIDRIDEEARQVWFHGSGRNPGEDPYLLHYYRVNFDGTGLTALTEGNGHHAIQYSPDRKFLIDTWSRVDAAPKHALRRTSDGAFVCALEEADITELLSGGWEPPEVFTAKGRDGATDIWGIICRPRGLDPAKKYPVIEPIYAGPQSYYTPKTFSGSPFFSSFTDLGYIVVQMDGMGTANRSKAFHDVCWKDLKDAGFPDRILWHKAAAARYPYYDITRVGTFGTSAGGQNAAGALLFFPEFYKAAAANSGCHDNRMDKASWNEQWMGYPVGPQYSECSNIDNAGRLRGHLFLAVGEMDKNVPPESTLRFVDALIRANKDFDLLIVPNDGHGAGGRYYQRRLEDFFARHLLGVTPPDRNAVEPIKADM